MFQASAHVVITNILYQLFIAANDLAKQWLKTAITNHV